MYSAKNNLMVKSFNDSDNIINLTIGDPDISTLSSVITDTFNDIQKGFTHYSDSQGDLELIKHIANYYREDFNISIDESEIFITMGASHGLFLFMNSILKENDEVIIPTPCYQPYENAVKLSKGKCVFIETKESEQFQINHIELKKAITNKTKMLLINSPNNPTGICYTEETIRKVISVINEQKNDIFIVLDDVYSNIIFNKSCCLVKLLKKLYKNTIIIDSFSKKFAMTGWRIGYIIAPENLINTIVELNECITSSASTISQRAAMYALRNRNQIFNLIIDEYKKRIDYSISRLERIPKIRYVKPDGTFYLFLDISQTGFIDIEIAELLLNYAHIAVVAGSVFCINTNKYIRMSCNYSISTLKMAFDRIESMEIFQN